MYDEATTCLQLCRYTIYMRSGLKVTFNGFQTHSTNGINETELLCIHFSVEIYKFFDIFVWCHGLKWRMYWSCPLMLFLGVLIYILSLWVIQSINRHWVTLPDASVYILHCLPNKTWITFWKVPLDSRNKPYHVRALSNRWCELASVLILSWSWIVAAVQPVGNFCRRSNIPRRYPTDIN